MQGVHSGVQRRLKEFSPNAVYVHCNAHNLNLILCDSAQESAEVKKFFGVIQQVYNFLSGSAPRWASFRALGETMANRISKNHDKVVIKNLCPTRWESRYQTVLAMRLRYKDVLKTLANITLTACNTEAKQEARALTKSLERFEFIFLLHMWEKVLRNVNIVSKKMQNIDMDISLTHGLLKTVEESMSKLRTQFEDIHETAHILALSWGTREFQKCLDFMMN